MTRKTGEVIPGALGGPYGSLVTDREGVVRLFNSRHGGLGLWILADDGTWVDFGIVLPDTYEGSVFFDVSCRLFRALYSRRGFGVMTTESGDGIHWGPWHLLLRRACDTNNSVVYDERLGRYVLFLRAWKRGPPWRRTIVRYEVGQLEHLRSVVGQAEPPESPFVDKGELPPIMDYEGEEIALPLPGVDDWYTWPVSLVDGVYRAFPSWYHHEDTEESRNHNLAEGVTDIYEAWSIDGKGWTVDYERPFLARGGPGERDCGCLYAYSGMVKESGKEWGVYWGGNWSHTFLHLLGGAQERACIMGGWER